MSRKYVRVNQICVCVFSFYLIDHEEIKLIK